MVGDDRSPTGRRQDDRWAEFVAALRDRERPPFEDHWSFYRRNYAGRAPADGPPFAWSPSPEILAESNLGRWMAAYGPGSYPELHTASVRDRPAFWEAVVRHLGVVFEREGDAVLDPGSDVRDPRWFPGASMNIVESCFGAPPDRPALVSRCEGSDELRVTTYGELERLVERVACGLRDHGFAPGYRIALYLPMNVECVAAYLGIVRAGCCAVSIADSFPAEEVARRLEIADAKGIVTVDVQHRAGKEIPLYDHVRHSGTSARAIVIPCGDDYPRLRPGDLSWARLLACTGRAAPVTGDPRRVINVLFSSGTTGTPKAIPWTHLTPLKCAMDGFFHQDIRPDDVVAWPTNIGWMMGPWLIFAALMNRATIALYDGAPNTDGFTRFVEDVDVSVLGVVPSLVSAWRARGFLRSREWPRVRLFSSTGEPSNREDYLWLMSRTGYRAPVIEYLGGTEIGGGYITGTVVQPASPSTFTTPALGIDLVLLDPDGRPVADGHPGEAYLVPPSIGLSQALLNADHAKVYYRGCPPGPEGEVLRRHGDRFVRIGQGFAKTEGRVDDTMNLGGIKVGSLELERVLLGHEAVAECAAVGVRPEGEGMERLVVFVVPADASAPTPPDELRAELDALLSRRLNPLFRVHEVVLVTSLPRTASNKLMRRELQARYPRGG